MDQARKKRAGHPQNEEEKKRMHDLERAKREKNPEEK